MAIDRYRFTKKHKNDCYGTTRYPKFPKRSTDLYIISREGDRLDNLSNEFYEDPRYWWILAEVNKLGHGTFNVEPGIQLRIPLPLDDLTSRLREVEENK